MRFKALVFSLLISLQLLSQDIAWVKNFNGTGDKSSNVVTVDSDGNVYTAGGFNNTVDFDPNNPTVNRTSNGNTDAFISKLDNDGNFIWVKQIGGTGKECISKLKVDKFGNIYAIGMLTSSADFDPSNKDFILKETDGKMFALKLNSLGELVWVKQFGSNNALQLILANSLDIDISGNVYVAGNFTQTIDFDPGSAVYNLVSAGSIDFFILKLNDAGNFVWAKSMGGTKDDNVSSIKIDLNGNVYTTGYFNGTSDFDPGVTTYNLTPTGQFPVLYDIFISKLDNSGNFIWAKKIGGEDFDYGNAVELDKQGNVYLTGYYGRNSDFDPSDNSTYILSSGSYQAFVSKLNSSGDFVWAKGFKGSLGYGRDLVCDTTGYLYVTGQFEGKTDFNPSQDTLYLTPTQSFDAFVSKFNLDGNFIWAQKIGGVGYDAGISVSYDKQGSIFTSGYFNRTGNINPTDIFSFTSEQGNSSVFVNKITQIPNGLNETDIANNSLISVFPNPFNNSFQIQAKGDFAYSIYDAKGMEMEKGIATSDEKLGSNLSKGLYLLKINQAGMEKMFKIIKD